ncbi:MAG TPA: hypothetical protein VF624_15000 [Tepidisphaeraceae bacterium]|jgi:hypothetical protein
MPDLSNLIPYLSIGATVVIGYLQVKTRQDNAELARAQVDRNRADDDRRAERAKADAQLAGQLVSLQSKLDEMTARRESDVKALSDKVHDITNKMFDEREHRISHALKNHAQTLAFTTEAFTRHAKESDDRFRKIEQAGPGHESALVKAIGEVREFVRERAVDRKAFDTHCDKTERAIENLGEKLNKIDRETLSREDLKRVLLEVKRET